MDIDDSSKNRSQSKNKSKNTKQAGSYKSTGQFRTKAEDFKQPVSGKKLFLERREDRMNRTQQLRKNKINEYILKKRGLIDSDASDTSLNMTGSKLINTSGVKINNYSMSNLTGLIDTTAYKIPPKLCALVALNDCADLPSLMKNFELVLKEEGCPQFNNVSENMWTAQVPHNLFKGKERISLISTKRDIYSILDACKVADMIVFVSSCKQTEYTKWKTDPDKYAHAIDEFGYKILSILRAQGLPQHISVMQDTDVIPQKYKSDIKKLFSRYFESELKPDKIFNVVGSGEKNTEMEGQGQTESVLNTVSKDEYKSIIRFICSVSPFSVSLDIRKHRSYMLCEKINFNSNNEIELSGYIRGNTLNISNYVHITGFGDYLVTNVENDVDPCHIQAHNKSGGMDIESSQSGQSNGNTLTNQKTQNKSDDDKIENTNLNGNKPQTIGNFVEDKDELVKTNKIMDEIIDFDIEIKDDGEDLSFDEDEEHFDEEEQGRISNKHILKTTLKYRTDDEMEFPDEVDTPIDFPARERFSKYRGLPSLKQGTWDPLEDLPKEYANIYSFENLRHLYKLAVRKAHDEGMKISGNFVKITLKGFNKDDLTYCRQDVPLIVSTLLEHERKLCVMHYKISLNYEYEGKVVPKSAMETQCGFRRLLTRPIYSSDIGVVDKFKIEKRLEKDKFFIASVYSQMTYPHSPVLLFKPNMVSNQLELVASGEVINTDSKKIILKRIILTGYPLKIKKKKSVVRYMFFNPTDVNYFKPIQLTTKNGLRGHITESLGTHGYMKCIFNDYIKASDTICLNLYKRVFPKWLKETWRYKVFYGNRNDYKNYFEEKEEEEKVVQTGNVGTMNID
jgi:pre-rRNA-processing protein TSR1